MMIVINDFELKFLILLLSNVLLEQEVFVGDIVVINVVVFSQFYGDFIYFICIGGLFEYFGNLVIFDFLFVVDLVDGIFEWIVEFEDLCEVFYQIVFKVCDDGSFYGFLILILICFCVVEEFILVEDFQNEDYLWLFFNLVIESF